MALEPRYWEAQHTKYQWSPVRQHLHSPHHWTVLPLFLVEILRQGKTHEISEGPIAHIRYAASGKFDKSRYFSTCSLQ